MEIYLLRHGIAEDGKPAMRDADRALTEDGREKLKRVLKRAKAAGVQPDVILSSPYRRAIETAQVAVSVLSHRGKIIETRALVPNAAPHEIWEELRSRQTESSILLASHEPLMSSTLAFLLANPALLVDMKKAALARVDCDRFGPQPHCVLKWLLTPALAGE